METFLVAAETGNERSVGEVEEVPGVTEAELRAAVIAEITSICEPLPQIRPDEVTVRQMAQLWNCSQPTAQRRLDDNVENGKLSWRWVMADSRKRRAYRVTE